MSQQNPRSPSSTGDRDRFGLAYVLTLDPFKAADQLSLTPDEAVALLEDPWFEELLERRLDHLHELSKKLTPDRLRGLAISLATNSTHLRDLIAADSGDQSETQSLRDILEQL